MQLIRNMDFVAARLEFSISLKDVLGIYIIHLLMHCLVFKCRNLIILHLMTSEANNSTTRKSGNYSINHHNILSEPTVIIHAHHHTTKSRKR